MRQYAHAALGTVGRVAPFICTTVLAFWATVGFAAPSNDDAALQARVRRLAKLVRGSTDIDVPARSLFAIDLSDTVAVQTRIAAIDEQLADLTAKLPAIATSSTSTASVDAKTRGPMLEFRALVLEVEFLRQPKEILLERVRAVEARFEARTSSELSRQQTERAEAEAKDAEREKLRALEEAQRARTEALKALKARRAQIAQTMSTLAGRAQKLSEAREALNAAKERAFRRMNRHVQQTRRSNTATTAPAMFEESTLLLDRALLELEAALDRHGRALDLPTIDTVRPKLDPRATADEREAAFEVTEALQALEKYTFEIRASERLSRIQNIESWLAESEALERARVRVVASLTGDARGRVFGYSMSGVTEARRELRAVQLTQRARFATRIQQFKTVAADLKNFETVMQFFILLLKVLVVVAVSVWMRRRVPHIRKWLERHQLEYARSLVWLRRLAFLQRSLERYASPVLFIAALHVSYIWIGGLGDFIEAELLYTVVVWFSYYWLLRVFVSSLIVLLARRRLVHMTSALRRKIERTTISAGRVALVFGLFLALARRVLGDGVLYHHGQRVVLVASVLALVFIVRSWQTEIARAYLTFRPTGTLARLVDESKDRYYSFVVVLAAFVLVAIRGAVAIGRETVLQFDQIRKALAFLFRKRLERKVEELGRQEDDLDRLPDTLHHAFTTAPLADGDLRVDLCPGIDKFECGVDAWIEKRAKGSFLLLAPRGYGKTTWLGRAAEIVHAKEVPVELRTIVRDQPLAAALELEDLDTEAIIEALNAGPPRVILIDDAHNLVLRELGGYAGVDALLRIVEATGDRVYWVVAADELAWRYVNAARPQRIRFRAEQNIHEWSEADIRLLLMARAAASGVVHQFEDLVVDEGSADSENALARSSEAYTRLIWDYADGCPMVACHYWLRSLAYVTDTRVRVRLFSAPEVTRLERMPEEARFVYAAIATHGTLSSSQVARVLRMAPHLAESTLLRGAEEGMLSRIDDTDRYQLSVHWYREIIRDLRRRHLI